MCGSGNRFFSSRYGGEGGCWIMIKISLFKKTYFSPAFLTACTHQHTNECPYRSVRSYCIMLLKAYANVRWEYDCEEEMSSPTNLLLGYGFPMYIRYEISRFSKSRNSKKKFFLIVRFRRSKHNINYEKTNWYNPNFGENEVWLNLIRESCKLTF